MKEEKPTDREQMMQKLDALYQKISAVNSPLFIKKQLDGHYEFATFIEAMDFTVTSNALSLIRSVYQNSLLSPTTALSARDIIEALVLIRMWEEGVVTEEDEELFLWQYALMEYDTYYKDGERFKVLLNLDDLTKRYERAKKIYNDAGISGDVEGGKLRQTVHTRIPFLCRHAEYGRRPDFNSLLSGHLPSMLEHYGTLSYYAHPNYNSATKSRDGYIRAIDAVINAVAERYLNYDKTVGVTVGNFDINAIITDSHMQAATLTERLEGAFNSDDSEKSVPHEIHSLMLKQEKILGLIAEDFEDLFRAVFGKKKETKLLRPEDNYVTRFFGTLPSMLYDVTFDYLLNLRECVKIKFKSVAETFAHFDRVITESICSRAPRYGTTMLKFYELAMSLRRQGKKLPDALSPTTAELICRVYRENYPEELYPESSVYYNKKKSKKRSAEESDKQIMQSFCQSLGNFVDGNGYVPKFLDLIDGYFKKTYGEQFILNRADAEDGVPVPTTISAQDYMNMLYRESNNMSHGCGYLYFSNKGALGDDGPIMQALDYMILGAAKTVTGEIERWQKEHGKEAHESVNKVIDALLKNLGLATDRLAFIALKKSVLFQMGMAE